MSIARTLIATTVLAILSSGPAPLTTIHTAALAQQPTGYICDYFPRLPGCPRR